MSCRAGFFDCSREVIPSVRAEWVPWARRVESGSGRLILRGQDVGRVVLGRLASAFRLDQGLVPGVKLGSRLGGLLQADLLDELVPGELLLADLGGLLGASRWSGPAMSPAVASFSWPSSCLSHRSLELVSAAAMSDHPNPARALSPPSRPAWLRVCPTPCTEPERTPPAWAARARGIGRTGPTGRDRRPGALGLRRPTGRWPGPSAGSSVGPGRSRRHSIAPGGRDRQLAHWACWPMSCWACLAPPVPRVPDAAEFWTWFCRALRTPAGSSAPCSACCCWVSPNCWDVPAIETEACCWLIPRPVSWFSAIRVE